MAEGTAGDESEGKRQGLELCKSEDSGEEGVGEREEKGRGGASRRAQATKIKRGKELYSGRKSKRGNQGKERITQTGAKASGRRAKGN